MSRNTSAAGNASTCALCPKLCRSACPVTAAEASEATTPTGLLSLVHLARHEKRPLNSDEIELLGHCNSCRGCETLCELGQRPADLLLEERSAAFSRGQAPPAAAALAQRLRSDRSPYGPDQRTRLREASPKGHFRRKGRVLLWPGCSAIEHQAEALAPLLALFERLGADHVSLPARKEVPCCGAWLDHLGDREGFRQQADSLEQWLNRQRSVVVLSGECLTTFGQRYGQVGVPVRTELFHLSEYLMLFADALKELAAGAREAWLERGGAPSVAYHDPCQLARGGRATNAPRQLLELLLGEPPTDLVHSGASTRCCGAAGAHRTLYPETASRMADAVRADYRVRRASWLVSGSPSCAAHLADGSSTTEVMDLSTLVLRYLEPVL